MGCPRAIVANAYLAQLVLSHPLHGFFIGIEIVTDGDLRGHASDCVHAAFMAGVDQQFNLGAKEGLLHNYIAALRQHTIGPVPEFLNKAEDVIPAAAVQSGGVVAQFVQDLVHLKSR